MLEMATKEFIDQFERFLDSHIKEFENMYGLDKIMLLGERHGIQIIQNRSGISGDLLRKIMSDFTVNRGELRDVILLSADGQARRFTPPELKGQSMTFSELNADKTTGVDGMQ